MNDHDREVAVNTLLQAADEWSEWEVFLAGDGQFAIRMHDKSPDEWLRERAEKIKGCHD